MKTLKSPQRVLILFLSTLIVISSILIVRLEIKAASLQSQWEEHQKSLKKNEDILAQLNIFSRYAGKGVIKMDDSGFILQFVDSWFYVANDEVFIETKGKLRMEAQGDINITSKNGNVNIKGKKVNLNEYKLIKEKEAVGDCSSTGSKSYSTSHKYSP